MEKISKVGLVYLLIDSYNKISKVAEVSMKRPKLGLDYLRSSLFEINIYSQLYDQQVLKFDYNSLIKILFRDKIDLLGFYVSTENINSVLNYIKMIKSNSHFSIIAGGPAAHIYIDELTKNGCDLVCIGEGEFTIREIIDYYNKEKNKNDIKGIAYINESNKIIFNLPRPLIKDLDSIPFPLRENKYINEYLDELRYTIKGPYISMLASRGCIYNCAFCTSHTFWGNTYRQRSVENVIEEIENNIESHHIKYIQFIDDIFAQNILWLEKFCNILKKKKSSLKWSCILHPLSFKGNKDLAFSIMAEAGCDAISFGAQSANKIILKNIDRNVEECEELRKSIYFSKLNNMTTIITYILGLPEDSLRTIEENYRFCIETKPHLVDFHPLCLLRSSKLDTKYQNNKLSELDSKELFKLSKFYMRKYYSNPEVFSQLFRDILRKNPKWFLSFLNYFKIIKAFINS